MRSWPLRPPLRHSMPAVSSPAWPRISALFVAPKWPNVTASALSNEALGPSGLNLASDLAALKSQQKIDSDSSRPLSPNSRRYFDEGYQSGSSLARSKFINNFIRPMTRLFCLARPPFERQPKDCGCLASLSVPRVAPRPDFEPKVSGSGSQRVPLLTVMKVDGGADAVMNGGENTV